MEAYTKFQHFTAYFLPGTVLFLVMLAVASTLLGHDLIRTTFSSTNFLSVAFISASILGLLLDGFRHVFVDEKIIEKKWSSESEQKYIDNLIYEDYQLYNHFVGEHWYYFEFSLNLVIVGILAMFCLPWYFLNFHPLPGYALLTLEAGILTAILILFKYAKECYIDFNTVSTEALKRRNK